jgi:MFS family permease
MTTPASTAIDDSLPHPPVSTVAAEPDWAPPRVAWFTMCMIGLVMIFGQMDRAIFYLLVSQIKADLQFSDTQMSLLMGVAFSGAYFLCGLPIARLSDVGRRKLILPAALGVWSLGTTLCAVTGNFWQLFAARSLVGAGESVKGPCAVSIISDLFPPRKLARGFAFYSFSIRVGEALALIVGGLLIGLFATLGSIQAPVLGELRGWHMIFIIFGAPGILFAFVFALTVKEPARHGRRIQGSVPLSECFAFLFKSRPGAVLIPILLAAAVSNIEDVGVGSWRPVFYERTYGWGPADFAPIQGLASLILTPIGLMLGAWLAESMMKRKRYDANMRVVLWAAFISIPLSIAGPLMPTFELALACSLSNLTLTIAASPCQLAAMQVVTPNELRGQVNALYMFTLSVLGQGLGPTVVALMTDYLFQSEADLRYAMVTTAAVAGPIALFLIWKAVRPYGDFYRAQMAKA